MRPSPDASGSAVGAHSVDSQLDAQRGELTRKLKRARQLRDEGDADRALREYLAILQIDPGHGEATLEVGEIYFRVLNRPDKADRYLATACRVDPESDGPIKSRAEWLVSQGRAQEASQLVDRWLKMPTMTARGCRSKARMFELMERPDDAVAAYKQAVELIQQNRKNHRHSLQAMHELAQLLRRLDRDKEAAGWYQAYLKLRPKDVSAVRGFATCLNAMKRNDDAIKLLRKCRELEPDAAWPLLTMARIRGKEQGRFSEGLELLDRFDELERDPRQLAASARVRGEIAEKHMRLEDARDAYERSIKLWDGDPHVYYALARVLNGLGSKSRAMKMASKAAELGKDQTIYAMALDKLEESQALLSQSLPTLKAMIDSGDADAISSP